MSRGNREKLLGCKQTLFLSDQVASLEWVFSSMESRHFRMRRIYFFCPVLNRLLLVLNSRFSRAAAIFMKAAYDIITMHKLQHDSLLRAWVLVSENQRTPTFFMDVSPYMEWIAWSIFSKLEFMSERTQNAFKNVGYCISVPAVQIQPAT